MIQALLIALPTASALLHGWSTTSQDAAEAAGQDSPQWVAQATPDEVARVLFPLEVEFPKDARFGNKFEKSSVQALGLRISPELAVTRYAPLVHSSRLKATGGEAKGMRIDVLGVDAELDLALLRLRPKNSSTRATEASTQEDWPVRLAPEGAEEDGELFTLQWSALYPGVARAESLSSMLSDGSDDRVSFGRHSESLGGMPVVDGSGWLAGIWRWNAPVEGSMEVEMTSGNRIEASVKRLLAEAESRDKSKPALPPVRHSHSLPRLAWPVVSGSPKKQEKAYAKDVKSALAAARRFANEVPCRECGGTGQESRGVIERVNNGKDKRTTYTSTCPDCDGDGILLPIPLWRTARIFAAKLTAVDPRAPEFDEVVRSFEESITTTHPVGKQRFLSRIRDSSIEALSPGAIQPGKSILFILPRREWESRTETDGKLCWIDGDLGRLLLANSSTRNVRGEGNHVMLAGTLAGQITHGGKLWTVLERTLAVPVRTDRETTGR